MVKIVTLFKLYRLLFRNTFERKKQLFRQHNLCKARSRTVLDNIYIYIYIYICAYVYLPTPPYGQDMTQGQIFIAKFDRLEFWFFFSWAICHTLQFTRNWSDNLYCWMHTILGISVVWNTNNFVYDLNLGHLANSLRR